MAGSKNCCCDLDCRMENLGDKLVITIKGDEKKIAMVERKLKALKELCCCCCCGEECRC